MILKLASFHLYLFLALFSMPKFGYANNFDSEQTNEDQPPKIKQKNTDACLNAMLERYLWDNNLIKSEDRETLSLKEKYNLANEYYSKKRSSTITQDGAWGDGIIPLIMAQEDALLKSIKMLGDPTIQNLDQAYDYLTDPTPKEFENNFYIKTNPNGNLIDFRNWNYRMADVNFINQTGVYGEAAILFFCGQISFLDALSCRRAIHAIASEVNYQSGLIFPHLWHEMITSEKMQNGLRIAAITMLERIKNAQDNNSVENDLTQSFKKAGATEDEAKEYTWKTMAIYANGGQNSGVRLFMFKNFPIQSSPLKVSLAVVASAMTVIDFKQRFSGKSHYILPNQVQGSCIASKPYHFWIPAYMSHRLVQLKHSSDASSMAAYIIYRGYHFNRNVKSFNTDMFYVFGEDSLSPKLNVMRLDLTFGSAGAVYGSLPGETHPLKLSEGLEHLTSLAGKVPAYKSPDEMSADLGTPIDLKMMYLRWDKIFNSNSIYDYFHDSER